MNKTKIIELLTQAEYVLGEELTDGVLKYMYDDYSNFSKKLCARWIPKEVPPTSMMKFTIVIQDTDFFIPDNFEEFYENVLNILEKEHLVDEFLMRVLEDVLAETED